jgi:ergot alkaloid biosynthesis protein
MRDRILVTGGSGKTGRRLAQNLLSRGIKARIASRGMSSGSQSIRFDWLDDSTYDAALTDVKAAYLVAPANVTSPLAAMQPFLERALNAGVERFVLLSASILEEGGPMMGEVHSFLKTHAPQWVVLRPTWFMQNFSEQQHLASIRDEGTIYSATVEGRVPFIDAADIAAVATQALVAPHVRNGDVVLTGPELLSYDQVAQLLSVAVGKTIIHRRLTENELAIRFMREGIAPEYARVLAAMDTAIAQGAENRLTDDVLRSTGRAPSDFWTFATSTREVWS